MADNKVVLTFTALDKASATMKRIHDRLDRMNKPLRNFKEAGGKLFGDGLGLNAASKSLKGVGDGLLQTARNVAVLGGAAYGLYRFAEGAVGAADAVGDLATKTGVAGRDIQIFGAMTEIAGGSTEDAANSISRLQRQMFAAKHGSKEAQKAFRMAGISMDELKKMTPQQVLERMADTFQKTTDQGRKLTIGNALMGKSSGALVAALSEGSAAIRKQAEEMERDGILFSPEQLAAADRLDKIMGRLSRSLGGLKNMLGLQLAEALSPMIESLTNWLKLNREPLKAKWADFLKDHLPVIIEGGKTAFKVLGTIVIGVAKAFAWMGHHLGTTGTTMVVLGVVLAPLLASLASLGGLLISLGMNGFPLVVRAFNALVVVGRLAFAVVGSLFRLMLANPFVALAAAVIWVGVVIFKNWDAIVGYISGAWARIKAAFSDGFFSGMFTMWLEGWRAFGNAILGIVKSVVPDFLMPKWLKDFNFGGMPTSQTKTTATPATPSAPAAAAAATPMSGAAAAAMSGGGMSLAQSIAGTINVMISDDRAPRVSLTHSTPGVDFRFYTGRTMAAS